MKRKLGNYIIVAFFINVFAIMSVGGVCILLVKDMVNNISNLELESEKTSNIDDINHKIHKMITSIHHSIIEADKDNMLTATSIAKGLENAVEAYQGNLENKGLGADDNEYILMGKISDNLSEIGQILTRVNSRSAGSNLMERSELKRLEDLGNRIQSLTETLKSGHFETIEKLVNDSYERMYFILFLYLTASFIGILASCVGYIVLTRHTIIPLKHLADATQKVASGDLSTRVATRSHTEIGTLYRSFNVMAERLEEQERKREEFNRELERLVVERTSELRSTNESLQKAHDDLVRMERIATLGQIATSVNHEIKTPLNSLSMNLQLLTKQIKKCGQADEEKINKMLSVASIIEGEVSRINGILEEFVKYARFAPPDLKQGDLNKLLRDIAGMISQNAEKAGVAISLSLDDKVVPLMLDEKKMTQALLNLCMNAIQAMPTGGDLTIASRKESKDVVVTISDTGTGIAPEDIEKIFDPFFTKKEGGLGFGLPIVQRIIEDHKGEITCRSKVGEYTVFEIKLPVQLLS